MRRIERGWPRHFICADRCLFRRNTLLDHNGICVVVSTVGLMKAYSEGRGNFEPIGLERFYETMAFHADPADVRYHDIDVKRQVNFNSRWCIDKLDADDEANEMHETVVAEITHRLEQGDQFDD